MAKKSPDAKMGDIVSIFKLLADSNRYRTVVILMRAKSGQPVSEIAKVLGMSHSSVSHMLAVLHDASIVAYKKKGREVLYMIAKTPHAKRVARFLRVL